MCWTRIPRVIKKKIVIKKKMLPRYFLGGTVFPFTAPVTMPLKDYASIVIVTCTPTELHFLSSSSFQNNRKLPAAISSIENVCLSICDKIIYHINHIWGISSICCHIFYYIFTYPVSNFANQLAFLY